MQDSLAQAARHVAVREHDRLAVGELERVNIERVGATVLGERCAGDSVTAAAFIGIQIFQIGGLGAKPLHERGDIGADPLGDGPRHAATHRRGRLQ
jgi:hypothetical protein